MTDDVKLHIIDVGSGPNTGTGEQAHSAFNKINANFKALLEQLEQVKLELEALKAK